MVREAKKNILNNLSPQQQQTLRNFTARSRNDYVYVDKNATVADVYSTMVKEVEKSTGIDELLDPNSQKLIQDQLLQKYREKLQQAAQQKGFKTPEEMLEANKAAELKAKKEKLAGKQTAEATSEAETAKPKKSEKLPSYIKSLDEIFEMDKIMAESTEKIAAIWNQYHSSRKAISATLEPKVYEQLAQRGKEFPMFVLPLAREEGFEMYFLQFQGNQVYFTPLMEYQLNRENARPSFSITFYTELSKDKDIVLMVGETQSESSTLQLKDAQHLVYQLQLFYITGTQEQKDLVAKFWKEPANFDYHKQIELLTSL